MSRSGSSVSGPRDVAVGVLLDDLNERAMKGLGVSRRTLYPKTTTRPIGSSIRMTVTVRSNAASSTPGWVGP